MTVQIFINLALRDLGNNLFPGQTPSPDVSTEALNVSNEILGSWSHEGLLVPTHAVTSFSLTAGTSSYTLGAGATWNTSGLAIKVKGALASLGNFQGGVQVMPMGKFEASIQNGLGRTAVLPSKMGIDKSAPTRNVMVWPIPNSSSATILLTYWLPLALLVNLTDTLSFAEPAFELALRNELTNRMANSFRSPVTEAMAAAAQSSKAALATVDPSEPASAAEIAQATAQPQQQAPQAQ